MSLPEVEEARTELVINHLRQQLADALARMDDNRRALADALGFDHSSLSFAALVSEAARTTVALAAAELRGAQRQREADVKALRDEAARNVSRDDVFYKLALQYAADHLVLAPLAASPEETQP